MLRTAICLAAMLLSVNLHTASAQTTSAPAQATTAPASSDAKPGRLKLTMEKLKQMKAKWSANRPKLKACRAEVKAKGLIGDDRWFYIEDYVSRSRSGDLNKNHNSDAACFLNACRSVLIPLGIWHARS
jgi:hypothetical protein